MIKKLKLFYFVGILYVYYVRYKNDMHTEHDN